jgi:hypothetical protein
MTSTRLFKQHKHHNNNEEWRNRSVTICIAAICQINYDPKVVMCSDRQIGSALGTSEMHKVGNVRPGWMFQFAGEVDAHRTMLPFLRVNFKEYSGGIDETNIVSLAHTAVYERTRELATFWRKIAGADRRG